MTELEGAQSRILELGRAADRCLAKRDFVEALRIHEERIRLLGAAADFVGQAFVRMDQAWVLEGMGRLKDALALNRQNLYVLRRAGKRRHEAITLRNIARLMAGTLRGREAIGVYRQALAIQEELGEARDRAVTLGALAALYARLGRTGEARAIQAERLQIVSDLGDERERVLALADLALLAMDQGRFVEAADSLQDALAFFSRAGELETQSALLSHLARCHAELGERDALWRLLHRRRVVAAEIGSASEQADVQAEIASYLAEEGNTSEALALFRDSLDRFTELGDMGRREVVLRQYARLKSQRSRIPWLTESWILFKDGLVLGYRGQVRRLERDR